MTATMHKLMVVCICPAVWLMQSGCATSSRAAPAADKENTRVATPLTADVQKDLGKIGVVSARFAPKVRFQAPTREKGAGGAAGRTAGRALGKFWLGCGMVIGETAETIIIPALALYGCAVLTPFVAVGGALYGHSDSDTSKTNRAAKAKHKTEIKKLRPVVDSALEILAPQPSLQVVVLEQAQAHTHHTFINVTETGTNTSRKRAFYRTLANKGISTILEVTTWRLEFTPEHAFVLTAKTRLIRTTDNKELYVGTYKFRTETRTISEWTAGGGKPLATALTDAYQVLAERIVDSLFVFHPVPHSVTPQDGLYLM